MGQSHEPDDPPGGEVGEAAGTDEGAPGDGEAAAGGETTSAEEEEIPEEETRAGSDEDSGVSPTREPIDADAVWPISLLALSASWRPGS